MATAGKGTVQFVNPKKRVKDGAEVYDIIIDGVSYYDSKGSFKDKMGQTVEFEWSPSQDGNLKFINPVGGGFKSGAGGFRGKSPEELALQKHSFALAYAKDLTSACINATAHLVKELPAGMMYLNFVGQLVDESVKATERTMVKFLALLDGKKE